MSIESDLAGFRNLSGLFIGVVSVLDLPFPAEIRLSENFTCAQLKMFPCVTGRLRRYARPRAQSMSKKFTHAARFRWRFLARLRLIAAVCGSWHDVCYIS